MVQSTDGYAVWTHPAGRFGHPHGLLPLHRRRLVVESLVVESLGRRTVAAVLGVLLQFLAISLVWRDSSCGAVRFHFDLSEGRIVRIVVRLFMWLMKSR